MKNFSELEHLLKCLECKFDLCFDDDRFICENCGKVYPVIDGVARFVPDNFWRYDEEKESIEEKTKNYFGFEWEYFENWGFHDEYVLMKEIRSGNPITRNHYFQGTLSGARRDFKNKCRMSAQDLKKGKFVLDAGCGNGRYTYQAAKAGEATIIGVDIGYGSVSSAFKNTHSLDNVFIVQGSLFDLPFKDESLDTCFSNGVLMHTGNAAKAFDEIARTIKPEGVFLAHVYKKLNPIWEFNDALLRSVTTKLSVKSNMRLARILASLSRLINRIPDGFRSVNKIVRLQPTVHHMYDWYSAPIATHHTIEEVTSWFEKNSFFTPDVRDYGGAINGKGKKNCYQLSREERQSEFRKLIANGLLLNNTQAIIADRKNELKQFRFEAQTSHSPIRANEPDRFDIMIKSHQYDDAIHLLRVARNLVVERDDFQIVDFGCQTSDFGLIFALSTYPVTIVGIDDDAYNFARWRYDKRELSYSHEAVGSESAFDFWKTDNLIVVDGTSEQLMQHTNQLENLCVLSPENTFLWSKNDLTQYDKFSFICSMFSPVHQPIFHDGYLMKRI